MKLEKWSLRQWHWVALTGIFLFPLIYLIDLAVGRPLWIVTRSFHMGYESNITTWYSSGILLAAGIYAFLCYRIAALQNIKPCFGWLLASFFLIGLSCDEVACLHESLGNIASSRMPDLHENMPHTIWPLLFAPVVLVVVVAMIWILYSHLRGAGRAGLLLLLGLGFLLGSAMFLEMSMNLLDRQENRWLWEGQMILEETGEIIGSWLIGLGLITRLELYHAVAAPIESSVGNSTLPAASETVVAVS